VNQIVKRKEETKLVIDAPKNFNSGNTLETWTQFTSGITSTSELYSLLPPVGVGTNDYQRVGNVIQPTSLVNKIKVCMVGRSVPSCSVYVDLFFLTSKTIKDYHLNASILTDKLMNVGDGTNAPYDGTSFTAMYPINKSLYNVIKWKRIKLQKSDKNPNQLWTSGEEPSSSTSYYSTEFSVKIPCPKKLLYRDSTQAWPTNFYPFMCAGFHATDQNGDTALLSAALRIQAQSHLYYKDA